MSKPMIQEDEMYEPDQEMETDLWDSVLEKQAAPPEPVNSRVPGTNIDAYLSEMRNHPRITPQRELVLGQRIKNGHETMIRLVLESSVKLAKIKSLQQEILQWQEKKKGSAPGLNEAITFIRASVDEIAFHHPRNKALETLRRRLSRIENKVREGLDEMVTANLRFVVSVAKKYMNRGLGIEDLIQEGNLGLIKAAGMYDYTTGNRFSTYAIWWIRQYIRRAICSKSGAMRRPANAREPITVEMNQIDFQNTPSDFQGNEDPASPLDSLSYVQLCHSVRGVLAELPGREQRILRLRFGIETDETLTLEEVGRDLKISRERVRQLEIRALRRLREQENVGQLESFLVCP